MSAAGMAPLGYVDVLPEHGWVLHECTRLHEHDVRWTERHLQCVWFDDRLRPCSLKNDRGEPISVLDPGRWNIDAGPDFLDAVLAVGADRRRVRGDVEIHIRPGDWQAHRHGEDPRYAKVILHVTFFPGPRDRLPEQIMHTALRDGLLSRPTFTFDDIDVSAYPHGSIPGDPRPCAAILRHDRSRAEALLDAAGRYRLEMKAARMRAKLRAYPDRRQIFYEEVMAALGYQHNHAVFRHLARRVPVRDARATDVESRYALLAGAAGLLPSPDRCRDDTARLFLRRLWDLFWQSGEPPPCEAAFEWRLGGIRPMNHPLRRLAAGAELFHDPHALIDRIDAIPVTSSRPWLRACSACFRGEATIAYWQWHLALESPRSDRPLPLLGSARISAILSNVVLPLWMAENRVPPEFAEGLPTEQISAPMRLTAARLLGRDHPPAIYARHGLRQQGLLQIYRDFCLRTRAGCRDCELPQRVSDWAPSGPSA